VAEATPGQIGASGADDTARIAALTVATDCTPFGTPASFMGQVPTPENVLGFALGNQEITTDQAATLLAAIDQASPASSPASRPPRWKGGRFITRSSGARTASPPPASSSCATPSPG
jgi:hypothetical protein